MMELGSFQTSAPIPGATHRNQTRHETSNRGFWTSHVQPAICTVNALNVEFISS